MGSKVLICQSEPRRIRTFDSRLKRPVLYQLSYGPFGEMQIAAMDSGLQGQTRAIAVVAKSGRAVESRSRFPGASGWMSGMGMARGGTIFAFALHEADILAWLHRCRGGGRLS